MLLTLPCICTTHSLGCSLEEKHFIGMLCHVGVFLCIYRMAFSSVVQMLPLYLLFGGQKCALGTLCHWFVPLAWAGVLLSELVGNFPSPFGDRSRRPWGLHVETVFAIAALCLHVWDLHQVSILYKLLSRYSACGVDCGAHGHMSCIKMKAAWCGTNEHTNYHTSRGPEFVKTLNCCVVRTSMKYVNIG